jgi:UDP-N-acetylglucosamine 2-epimerase (non-hydrolysing)
MKVLTLVGTRPELIKLSAIIPALDGAVEHILVHTGQNYDYELNGVFFDQLELRKPNHFLEVAGKNAAETIAQVIAKTDAVLELERPDAFLIYGDTNSCLGAIAAKKRKIPVFHMESGNRCFDQNVPEEINRKIIDHISDINMVISEHARRYLLAEGVRAETVIKTGSCMQEVLNKHKNSIEASAVLEQEGLAPKSYMIVSLHREETVDDLQKLQNILALLDDLVENFGKTIIFSTHPRTRKRLEALGADLESNAKIRFMKPFGFFEYIKLQQESFCVLSDSGTISEESSLLHFPAITLRETHERPEATDEGTVIMTGFEPKLVMDALRFTVSQFEKNLKPFETVVDYNIACVSDKVVKTIMSYTPYINKYTWRK